LVSRQRRDKEFLDDPDFQTAWSASDMEGDLLLARRLLRAKSKGALAMTDDNGDGFTGEQPETRFKSGDFPTL
jgi:hypothetical protein